MSLLLGFSVLFMSSLLFGLTIVLFIGAIRAMRSSAQGGAAGRDLRPLFPALFAATGLFLLLSLPPVLSAVRASLPAFIAFGVVSAAAIAFWRKRRGVARSGVVASCLFAGAVVLFVFALFRFLTAAMSPLDGETLAALVAVEPTKLEHDVTVEKGPATLTIHAGSPAVRLTLTPMDDEQTGSLRFELPGEKWGVGGEVLEVKNWLLFFGTRAFFRLTHVDAKFTDNEIPHYGKNLPGYDPKETMARLEAKVPFLERTVRDLCGAHVESTRYEDVVYRRVDEGRFYALVARDQGGFVPRPISEEEYRRQLGPRAGEPQVVP
ncbi:MAG: hypothetical protein HYR85_00070 [Planctomycetes bacterium]|nr:hypothetical protein [Planctomycetota bacterium]